MNWNIFYKSGKASSSLEEKVANKKTHKTLIKIKVGGGGHKGDKW